MRPQEGGHRQVREGSGKGDFLPPLPLAACLVEPRQVDREAIMHLSAILGLPYGPDRYADLARRVTELAAMEERVRSATMSRAASPAPVPHGTPVQQPIPHPAGCGCQHQLEAAADGDFRSTRSSVSALSRVQPQSRPRSQAGPAQVARPAEGARRSRGHDVPQAILDGCKPQFIPEGGNPGPPPPFHKKVPTFDPLAGQDALDFLMLLKEYIEHYGLTESQAMAKVVPSSLVGAAKGWLFNPRTGMRTWENFQKIFLAFYLPKDYRQKIFWQLERRRQGQDEPLINFLTVIEEYYECAAPETPGYLRVDRVARQARKENRNYLFNCGCINLAELCAAAF